MLKKFPFHVFLSTLLCLCSSLLFSQEERQELVEFSEAIGTDIDAEEREQYRLFPDIDGYLSARIIQQTKSRYVLEYEFEDRSGKHRETRAISADAVELTRLHVRMVERYLQPGEAGETGGITEAEMMYRMVLKYAAQAQYNITAALLDDLLAEYPNSEPAGRAQEFQSDVGRLRKSGSALFIRGALLDQNGRTDLLLFSGYYGLWLGLATPGAFESESSQAYAAGLLLGGPLSVLLTHQLTKEAKISEGRATMIELGGLLGTWQGLGWTILADDDNSSQVLAIGEVVGLTGIAAATLLSSKVEFSEGHAALTSSAMPWGAWFGAIYAAIADHDDDDFLRDLLIGSDIFVVATGIAARNVRMSEARMRLINLSGILGAVAGFGIDLLIEVDSPGTAMTIAGLGSITGIWAGVTLTRNFDSGKDLAKLDLERFGRSGTLANVEWSVSPQVIVSRAADARILTPALGVRLNF